MAQQFGELVLVLGDLHIPHRVDRLPQQFMSLLVPGKMQHILCTGNLCSNQVLEHFRTIAGNVHVARGDFDMKLSESTEEFPERCVVNIGAFRIGVIHGHQIMPWGDASALEDVRKELDVDILISGHTHKNEVFEQDGYYFVNPGSATGAYSPLEGEVIPSFVLMAVKDDKVVTYVYELREGEVKVSKNEFTKAARK